LSTRVPPPPDPGSLDPLLLNWEAGRAVVRCHSVRFGATEFNPGSGCGRFHPFAGLAGKETVPVLYAADDLDGCLSETIFHDVPVSGPGKRVGRFALEEMVVSTLTCERELTLVQLSGFGLRRLGVSRLELIESGAEDYRETAAWARSLHASSRTIDGLIWVSRQKDDSRALVLFGDRVARSSLRIDRHPLALYVSPGFDEVQRAAGKAGILILD
jgi:RES domain